MATPSTNLRGAARRSLIRQEILRRMKANEPLGARAIRKVTGGSYETIQEELDFLSGTSHEVHLRRETTEADVVASLEDKLQAAIQREILTREKLAAADARIQALESTINLLKAQPLAGAPGVTAGMAPEAIAELKYLVDRVTDSHRTLLTQIDAFRQASAGKGTSSSRAETQSSEAFLLEAKVNRLIQHEIQSGKTIERLRARLAEAGLDDS